MIDWALFLVSLLVTLCGVLTWMYMDAEREIRVQRNRLEEAEMWLMLEDEELAALRRRLADVERRHGNLQMLYAQLTRRLLAKNFVEIEQYVRRKRQME